MKGSKGIGLAKHRKSGRSPKSPKLRLSTKLEAERSERKPRQSVTKFHSDLKDLFSK